MAGGKKNLQHLNDKIMHPFIEEPLFFFFLEDIIINQRPFCSTVSFAASSELLSE